MKNLMSLNYREIGGMGIHKEGFPIFILNKTGHNNSNHQMGELVLAK